MTSSPERFEDQRAAALRLLVRSTPPPADQCPDPAALAGLAEGCLPADARPALERHLAACHDCREVLATLLPGGLPAARPNPLRWALLLAAAVLFALGAGAWWLLRPPTPDHDARLVAAAAVLARAEPELFPDFRPLPAQELDRLGTGLTRGASGLLLQHPRGRVLRERPPLWFLPAVGGSDYRFVLTAEDGSPLGQAALATPPTDQPVRLDWPLPDALPSDVACTARLQCEGPLGPETSLTTFQLATQAQRSRLEQQLSAIARHAAPPLVPELQAHLLLREGFVLEAEARCRAWLAQSPDHAPARALLAAVHRLLGVPGTGGQ